MITSARQRVRASTQTGFLSQPHTPDIPDIPGIASFDGKVVHTAAWDDSYRFARRRVAIIGTGATAVQLVPELAKEAADLTVSQRTPIHVVPKIDFAIPTVMQRLFARLPLMQRVFRRVTDTIFELITVSVLHYPQFRRLYIAAADLAKINRFVSMRAVSPGSGGVAGPPSRSCQVEPLVSVRIGTRKGHHDRFR